MSTRPIQRTTVANGQPWALTLRSTRPVHCPACGIKLPSKAGIVAGQILVCNPCLMTDPRSVTQAICICFCQQSSELWTYVSGLYLYTPRLGLPKPIRVQAVEDGRWPKDDMACSYPPYAPDWARQLSASLDEHGARCYGPTEPGIYHAVPKA